MKHKTLAILMAVIMVLTMTVPALAYPPAPGEPERPVTIDSTVERRPSGRPVRSIKPIDQPNPLDYQRMLERQRLLEAGQTAEANALALTGTDRVLAILVEFAGTDTFTWTAGVSTWDPLGIADGAEDTGTPGDCSLIQDKIEANLGYTLTTGTVLTFTYQGPLHNMIERPLSTTHRSGDSIWTEDSSTEWFEDFMFGNGVEISYTFQSGEGMYASFVGQSVADYYSDMSSGMYTVTGDVIGWLQIPHSTWYYGADPCPGDRSDPLAEVGSAGAIPGAGTPRSLAQEALDAIDAISDTIPGFDWANYDLDGDGFIDRLWFIHAGYGEEDAPELLNGYPVDPLDPTRTITVPEAFYGEAAIWSHSTAMTPYPVGDGSISAYAYVWNPENGGMSVFAHEAGHNLGADDLYAYGPGDTSAGFWTEMADSWTGHPIGFEPVAMDPWHLDNWGWLDPYIVPDDGMCHEVTLGQASRFETNSAVGDVYRGAKIPLPPVVESLAVPVWQGDYYWWGGQRNESNAMMTTVDPIDLAAATAATLTFDLVYDIEDEWDFLWVQISTDGTTWNYTDTLTNTNTQCVHNPGWIGEINGFPADLCGAGIGGFYGWNANWPDPETQVFDLTPYIGESIYLRFWFMTDWGTLYTGAFVDNVEVTTDAGSVFFDDAEAGDAKWTYAYPWERSDGNLYITKNYYLQWRNVNDNGGYDNALGEEAWRYGPANTGLLVWVNNNYYVDNEIWDYLFDDPSLGPKGRMLVVDSHPEPYRDPDMVALGYDNEGGNIDHRGLMRDAPFTLQDTVPFTFTEFREWDGQPHYYAGRPAVSMFSDAMGYYPGAEYVNRGPAYPPEQFKWVTKQWDASTVVPARDFYPLNAPGYDGTAANPNASDREFRFRCTPYLSGPLAGYLGCYWFGSGVGLGYEGGTGNPGDHNLQHGWSAELIEEATDHTWGKVRICNQQPVETDYEPKEISEEGTHFFTYTVTLNNAGTLPQTRWFTFTLDPRLTFVSASWAPTGTLEFPTYGWAGTVPTGALSFTLVASMTLDAGTLRLPGTDITTMLEHNDFMNPLYVENMVTVAKRAYIYLPVVTRNY